MSGKHTLETLPQHRARTVSQQSPTEHATLVAVSVDLL